MAHDDKQTLLPQNIQRTSREVCTRDGTVVRGLVFEKTASPKSKTPRTEQRPLLCLPGELRTMVEYHDFALELLANSDFHGPVFMMDLRGRGQSDLASTQTYSPITEAEDVIAFCDACELHHVTILTSARSSFIPLLIAPVRPSLVQAIIFNDGAPEFDGVGIARMKNILAQLHGPRTLSDGAKLLERILKNQFPAFAAQHWLQMSKLMWAEKGQKPIALYDKKLPAMVHSHDFGQPQPALWSQFSMFTNKPVMSIRGEHSPIVTKEFVEKMKLACPNLVEVVATGQGHVPLIEGSDLPNDLTNKILEFLVGNSR